MRSAVLGSIVAALVLVPGVAGAVATNVAIQSPAGEPIETGYVVLDEAGSSVAKGTTNAQGEDEQDLPPGVYILRSGDGEKRFEVREGQRFVSVSLTRSPVALRSWGFDLGAAYGYFDQDGSLESEIEGFTDRESSSLELNGTMASLYGRVRLPVEILGGQPFVQIEGDVDLSDAEDSGGRSGEIGLTEVSFVRLEYQAGLFVGGGVEWETGPLHGHRGLRLRPYGGLAFGWWDAELVNDRTAFFPEIEKDEDDFTTVSGRVGLELGVPLFACDRSEVDFVLGSRIDFPLGDDDRTFETRGGPALMDPVRGQLDLDESWAVYGGLEFRWNGLAPF
mgnify:CR=1 FL=1